MSAEEVKPLPVTETPAVEAATETPAVEAPKTEESKVPEEAPAATEAAAEAPAEAPAEAVEEAKPVEPKEQGHILYHAPGNFLKEFLPIPPKKVFFWFGEEPVESTQLKSFLLKGKDAATSTAAWASQTGKGLLFFNKHGEDKAAPTGALNLADAEDIKGSGLSEFTFKLGSHKHKFDAQTGAERDSWVAAVKKIAEEAKAAKDEILNSEGYKEALAKLKPAPVAALAAPKLSEETPKKSTDVPADAEETKKASKSRSRSRGPLGFLKSKKEEAKEKVESEDKKEETPAAEPAAAEAAPVESAPVTDATAAPVITDAVPAVEEKKEEAAKEPKKEGRRLSRFDNFFKAKPKEAKKEEAPVAEESAKAAEEPAAAAEETPAVVEPVAEAAPVAAATEESPKEETAEEEKKEETTPVKENRKSSFLTGLKGFTQKVRSPSSEHPPAVPAKDEAAPAEAAAETAAEPATEAPAAEAAPATEEPATNGETSKTEKRRSSFFNFGTIKKKADAAPAAEEPAKADATEEAAPATEEAAAPEVPAKTAEVEKPEASPKEHKESPFASIGRRVSKAIRGGDKPKKEAKAAPAVEEAKTEEATETPAATLPEPIKLDETPAIGDVVPEAVTVGSAPQSAPTVSATA